jgi:hypothetical protein
MNPMPSVNAKVALSQAGEDQPAARKQCRRDMGKQQIAKVVAIECAEQDDRRLHRPIVGQRRPTRRQLLGKHLDHLGVGSGLGRARAGPIGKGRIGLPSFVEEVTR